MGVFSKEGPTIEEGKTSAAVGEKARSELAAEDRPARVTMGVGGNLTVSPAILADIKSRGCVARWGLDDDKGKMDQYMAAYWEPYKDANGNQVTRPAGNGRQHVLIMLDNNYAEEDKALKRKRNNAILADKAKLGKDEYIPDDRQYVVQSDL